MLSHLSFGVSDLDRATAFYDAVMDALGYARLWANPRGVGYGPPGGADKLALFARTEPPAPLGPGFHLAFTAPTPEAVDRFHAAALANGGVDRGAPGLRERYSPSYYAAFATDLDGYKLEAVCQ